MNLGSSILMKSSFSSEQSVKGPIGISVAIGPEWDSELKRLKATPKAIQKALEKELVRMATNIRNNAIKGIKNTPRTGRKYRVTKNKSMWHVASSPGYYPASNSGDLLKSIKMDVRNRGLFNFEVETGSNIVKPKYPRFLEEGTKFMDARPWLEPAFEDGKRNFYTFVRRNINQSIKRAK